MIGSIYNGLLTGFSLGLGSVPCIMPTGAPVQPQALDVFASVFNLGFFAIDKCPKVQALGRMSAEWLDAVALYLPELDLDRSHEYGHCRKITLGLFQMMISCAKGERCYTNDDGVVFTVKSFLSSINVNLKAEILFRLFPGMKVSDDIDIAPYFKSIAHAGGNIYEFVAEADGKPVIFAADITSDELFGSYYSIRNKWAMIDGLDCERHFFQIRREIERKDGLIILEENDGRIIALVERPNGVCHVDPGIVIEVNMGQEKALYVSEGDSVLDPISDALPPAGSKIRHSQIERIGRTNYYFYLRKVGNEARRARMHHFDASGDGDSIIMLKRDRTSKGTNWREATEDEIKRLADSMLPSPKLPEFTLPVSVRFKGSVRCKNGIFSQSLVVTTPSGEEHVIRLESDADDMELFKDIKDEIRRQLKSLPAILFKRVERIAVCQHASKYYYPKETMPAIGAWREFAKDICLFNYKKRLLRHPKKMRDVLLHECGESVARVLGRPLLERVILALDAGGLGQRIRVRDLLGGSGYYKNRYSEAFSEWTTLLFDPERAPDFISDCNDLAAVVYWGWNKFMERFA